MKTSAGRPGIDASIDGSTTTARSPSRGTFNANGAWARDGAPPGVTMAATKYPDRTLIRFAGARLDLGRLSSGRGPRRLDGRRRRSRRDDRPARADCDPCSAPPATARARGRALPKAPIRRDAQAATFKRAIRGISISTIAVSSAASSAPAVGEGGHVGVTSKFVRPESIRVPLQSGVGCNSKAPDGWRDAAPDRGVDPAGENAADHDRYRAAPAGVALVVAICRPGPSSIRTASRSRSAASRRRLLEQRLDDLTSEAFGRILGAVAAHR